MEQQMISEHEQRGAAKALQALLTALGVTGPRPFGKRLRDEIEEADFTGDVDGAIAHVMDAIRGNDPNVLPHALFARALREWDAATDTDWDSGTERLSQERRDLILRKLALDEDTIAAVERSIPIARKFDQAIVIADSHQEWYTDERKWKHQFYWPRYKQYLETQAGWDAEGTQALDQATDQVIRRLSDPERKDAHAVRGLVVGYVQSGKTANFTAVVAKAIDAGYRVVIVLAGVLDSLRLQTQRRLDKELVGQEQINRDKVSYLPDEYVGDQDWNRFVRYGGMPSELGAFNLRRITTSRSDYRGLGQGKDVLRLEKQFADRAANHADNLHAAAARIIIIKKNSHVIRKLISDFLELGVALDDMPVLVIDDESDQASVNTVNPKRGRRRKMSEREAREAAQEEAERTSTNRAIVDLLAMFPRSQYIGYTATPAANAMINPEDSRDLFPRDFIELLPRPQNYMGISDFHDFDEDFNPLHDEEVEQLGVRSNRKAFVRKVENHDDDTMFRQALDAYFLAGAIKLFRHARDPGSVNVRHHTMLVHRGAQRVVHEDDRRRVCDLLGANAYSQESAKRRLWKLWEDDFREVCEVREPDLARPGSYAELQPFMVAAIDLFQRNAKQVLIVNGDNEYKDDMPDFDREDVWNILVGGAKLSRGYTVEGLTTTYFVRKAAAGDTLMQMGRWFGFRRGYRDLVRLYVGTQVPAGKASAGKGGKAKPAKTADLYEMFESICMDEERFRRRIAMYSRDGIRPIHVPPLVPMGMLVPTQRNKMYNAEIQMENFGGRHAESGRVTFKPTERAENVDRLASLVEGAPAHTVSLTGRAADGTQRSLNGRLYTLGAARFLGFLERYAWGTPESQFANVISFLKGTGADSPGVDQWLLLMLTKPSAKSHWAFDGFDHGVFERSVLNGRFKVFSEKRHRDIADHLTGISHLPVADGPLDALRAPRQAVALLYPTMRKGDDVKAKVADREITLGLDLAFPPNSIRQRMNWRVRDTSPSAGAFVDT